MNIPARFNLPPVTRGIGLAFVTLTCLHAYLRILGGSGDGADAAPTLSAGLPYLVLVPGLSWYLPWTPLTAALINRDPINLAMSALVLTLAGRYFERAWGSVEYTKFMLIIAIGPNVLCACMLATAYIITGSQDALYVFNIISVIPYHNAVSAAPDPSPPADMLLLTGPPLFKLLSSLHLSS